MMKKYSFRFAMLVLIAALILSCSTLGIYRVKEYPISPNSKLPTTFKKLLELYEKKDFAAISQFAKQRVIILKPIKKADYLIEIEARVTKTGIASVPEQIELNEGQILSLHKHLIHAEVPLSFLYELAKIKDVLFIYQPDIDDSDVVSEGVFDIKANFWQAAGFDGSGIKIAILENKFQGYEDRQANGELPGNLTTAYFGYPSFNDCLASDHGSKCAEVVHDVAPGADLYLVCYRSSEASFLNAINYLVEEGVDVVSHSKSNYRGPHNGTSRRSQYINQASKHGIVWINSAGNRAQQHWEGYFNNDGNGIHIWDGTDTGQNIHLNLNEKVRIRLVWNDWGKGSDFHPEGNIGNQDYRINLYRNGNLVAFENNDQSNNSNVDPYESLSFVAPQAGVYEIEVEAINNTGLNEYLELFVHDTDIEYPIPAGSIPIYGDADGSVTIGAVTTQTHNLRDYSGQGPTNGIGGGEPDETSRVKPDLVAPGNVNTWDGPFGGTSAAAPHVAGATALIKQRTGLNSPYPIKAWLKNHADLFTYGNEDNQIGGGLARLCLLQNPDASDGLNNWIPHGTPSVAGPVENQYFTLETEGSYLSQEIDISNFVHEIAAGDLELNINALIKTDTVDLEEGYPIIVCSFLQSEDRPINWPPAYLHLVYETLTDTNWTYVERNFSVPLYTPHSGKNLRKILESHVL